MGEPLVETTKFSLQIVFGTVDVLIKLRKCSKWSHQDNAWLIFKTRAPFEVVASHKGPMQPRKRQMSVATKLFQWLCSDSFLSSTMIWVRNSTGRFFDSSETDNKATILTSEIQLNWWNVFYWLDSKISMTILTRQGWFMDGNFSSVATHLRATVRHLHSLPTMGLFHAFTPFCLERSEPCRPRYSQLSNARCSNLMCQSTSTLSLAILMLVHVSRPLYLWYMNSTAKSVFIICTHLWTQTRTFEFYLKVVPGKLLT